MTAKKVFDYSTLLSIKPGAFYKHTTALYIARGDL